jgi:hypothetical protein
MINRYLIVIESKGAIKGQSCFLGILGETLHVALSFAPAIAESSAPAPNASPRHPHWIFFKLNAPIFVISNAFFKKESAARALADEKP